MPPAKKKGYFGRYPAGLLFMIYKKLFLRIGCAAVLLGLTFSFAGCGSKGISKPQPSDALLQQWANTPSDIAGMTKLDKYNAGLAVANGSDTDADGLTDKEELEQYHTDPLKVSSSGDLYSDFYKVQNDMDTATAYPFTGENYFPHNSCPEVQLSAHIPTDFNAVVTAVSAEQVMGLKVYAAYQVYNYGSRFGVDVGEILRRNDLKLSDAAVYVSDGNKVSSYSFNTSGSVITLKKNFSAQTTYTVYLTEKNFLRFAAAQVGLTDAMESMQSLLDEEPKEVTGSGLVLVSPLLTELIGWPIYVQSERLLLQEDTQTLQDKVVAHATNYFELDSDYTLEPSVKPGFEIDYTYEILSNLLSFCDITQLRESQLGFPHIFFIFYSYEGKLAAEAKDEAAGMTGTTVDQPENSTVSGFNPNTDTLPFGNFKTQYSPNGSCAGFSHLTAYVYNTGKFPASIQEAGWTSSGLSWDLTTDQENHTLYNPGLIDYKTASFVADHSRDGLTLSDGLSPGEEEFVKMMAASYIEGNKNAEFICYELFGGDFSTVTQDYAVIESAMAYLDSGKILDVYLGMTDGTRHTVNIFDYRKDPVNPDVVWFTVYDCNFPGNRIGSHTASDTGFSMRVERRVNLNGDGYTFAYDYFPLSDDSYGATSNSSICPNNMILILDENRRLLND